MANTNIYKCIKCGLTFGTTFISDGIGCPQCNSNLVVIGKVLNREEYNSIIKASKEKGIKD